MQKMHRAQEVLKQYFGYDQFRTGQDTLVQAVLDGQDVMGIMPTGAGKSICFQVPALLLPGVTLVISPLISLMKDQVMALCQAGVAAAYLNSSLTSGQYRRALSNLLQGQYKIVYVAPERLLSEEFLQVILQCDISLLAVDEAHCISQWGQDFRPSYVQIPQFIERLPHRPVLAAFTATATTKVKQDIVKQLALSGYKELVTGFDRPNLYFEVRQPRDKKEALLHIVHAHSGQNGIVYCATRKNVEEVCDFLQTQGCKATRYHAGLSPEERRNNQDDFQFDRCNIIVATSAFGMGIDKSDVRFVVHYNMPMDLESYYQEAGRAGRDGLPSDCILLYAKQDVMLNRFLIQRGNETAAVESDEERAALLQRSNERLRQMTFYGTTPACLRREILRYFGENAPEICDNCGNCRTDEGALDITQDAKKILLCVSDTGERFGTKAIVGVLRAEQTEQVLRWHLEESDCFGSMSGTAPDVLQEELRFLIARGYLRVETGQYPTLSLGAEAPRVLAGEETLRMKAPRTQEKSARSRGGAQKTGEPQSLLTAEEMELFETLRALRLTLARRQGLPAFAVFTDATLQDMCRKRPATMAQLHQVSGVGARKLELYGEDFLPLLRAFAQGEAAKHESSLL
ncbi:MAG: DNA helicase RecQ [Ruthenibacterium sp.]